MTETIQPKNFTANEVSSIPANLLSTGEVSLGSPKSWTGYATMSVDHGILNFTSCECLPATFLWIPKLESLKQSKDSFAEQIILVQHSVRVTMLHGKDLSTYQRYIV